MKYSYPLMVPAFLGLFLFVALPVRAQVSEEKIDEMAEEALTELEKEGFSFSFEDLKGNMVASDDERFKGKVVLVDIMGSWCRPCRLEAPFLEELYETYHEQGLEIVSIAFEFGDDKAKNIKKVKKFKKEFSTKYTVLYGGSTDDAEKIFPRTLARLGYPTVIMIDRDGTVQGVEAGFWDKSAQNIEEKIRTLLGETVDTAD